MKREFLKSFSPTSSLSLSLSLSLSHTHTHTREDAQAPTLRRATILVRIQGCCQGFPGGTRGKEPACQCRRHKWRGFDPWVRKIPWRRKWQPTPKFLPGESHGQRSLLGCSLGGHKESDTTEARLNTHAPCCHLEILHNFEKVPHFHFTLSNDLLQQNRVFSTSPLLHPQHPTSTLQCVLLF